MTTEKDPRFSIRFKCIRTGLYLGSFFPETGLYETGTSTEGMSPYVRDWKNTSMCHPLFSVSWIGLYYRAKNNYEKEKQGGHYPLLQKKIMLLALLHSAECIVQDTPGLPSDKIADTYFANVLEVLDWKMSVGSHIDVPKLHIWRGPDSNYSSDLFQFLPNWLRSMYQRRDEYNNVVRTKQREAKKKAGELALKSIKKQMYEDISLRRLWNWVEVQMPSESLRSQLSSLKDLFFADTEKQISYWSHEEIDELESLFLENCEAGNSISYEVQKRINTLRSELKSYEDVFEIRIGEQFTELRGTAEPDLKTWKGTKGEFLVAHARWSLANKKPTDAEDL